MIDNPLGLLRDYGSHILSACIIIYCGFVLYLTDFFENEDDYEN
jgi:hypothetical protein